MPNEDAVALIAEVRAVLYDRDAALSHPDYDRESVETERMSWGALRALCALAEQGMAWERMFTDEQAAHKLTAETLTKAIRDGDKAEQYRVERDKARKAAEQGMADTRRMEPTDECRHGYAVCEPCAFDRGYAAGQRGDPLDADEPTPLFNAMGLPPVPPIPRAATQEVP